MRDARLIRIRGVVQGVGFRPFVYREATHLGLRGWVFNESQGVTIHVEGDSSAIDTFVHALGSRPPAAAQILDVHAAPCQLVGYSAFEIRHSAGSTEPTTLISPDLPVCPDCLRELFDTADPRYLYPYINCTNCGPRYTVIDRLPYDRANTTMHRWPLDALCAAEYSDPGNRRFHAQPIACANCGPHVLFANDQDYRAVEAAAQALRNGLIIAVKGLGGYHLACDAQNSVAVAKLRHRKFRKEKPFALMAASLAAAKDVALLTHEAEQLLTSVARPIVLAPARRHLPEVSPENDELGVMLPYAPLHHLLFAAGAPDLLVMTSANRSSEPIAYRDEDALVTLDGIADAFLVGERPIARRVDDSVARAGAFGPVILRRSRGYAPGAVAAFPTHIPILALGADLKNTITLAVDGHAFVSQHIGDLSDYASLQAFRETIRDLTGMYRIAPETILLVHDAHPQYFSTVEACALPSAHRTAVQHHRAHIASVLAERGAWDTHVIGVSFDGTGYGDDGKIWGGEFFSGSVTSGFERVAHLRPAYLPGGDAAARYPVQCAAGFLTANDLQQPPFNFPERFRSAQALIRSDMRTFTTTSMGRLFDTAAALLGFTRAASFEGQAAMWLEHLARRSNNIDAYPFPFANAQLDYGRLLDALIDDRRRGIEISVIARRFHFTIARSLITAALELCEQYASRIIVLSGGVFQNELLLEDVRDLLQGRSVEVWTNHAVPPNDGGISLGQAALAALGPSTN